MKRLLPVLIVALFLSSSFVGISRPLDKESIVIENVEQTTSDGHLFDHQWPQQGYNKQHVGQSPYSTAENPGVETWRFPVSDWCDGSPVIGSDGTIYFGSSDCYLYAVYPDGTLKWKYNSGDFLGDFGNHPAIGKDGTIYIGTKYGSTVHAINPNGTLLWKFSVPEIDTSITIDDDGVIYYGHRGDGVDARYPNGTLKWRFKTEGCVQSTPAIDDNGVVYFGAHDYYIYAVYPNGTLKWKFQTGYWVHGSPTIGADGTVYCGSDDGYLYALYSNNGTIKWKVMVDGMRCSPSLDAEGNLYFGVETNKIYSVSLEGVIRWVFSIGNDSGIWGSTAAISDDGFVYIGSHIDFGMLGGGEIIALDLDGNLKWRKTLCNSVLRSSPVISSDGTVYICSSNDLINPDGPGHLHAFGPVDTNTPPSPPVIDGPIEGKAREMLTYSFTSNDLERNPVSYYIDWGDGITYGWTDDFTSGITYPRPHLWLMSGTYLIKAKARDTFGLESDWAYLEITIPRNKVLFDVISHRFPLLERLFSSPLILY